MGDERRDPLLVRHRLDSIEKKQVELQESYERHEQELSDIRSLILAFPTESHGRIGRDAASILGAFIKRRMCIKRALSTDQDLLWTECLAETSDKAALFGHMEGSWTLSVVPLQIQSPLQTVYQLPQPTPGVINMVNLGRDKWVRWMANISDSWLISTASFEAMMGEQPTSSYDRCAILTSIASYPSLEKDLFPDSDPTRGVVIDDVFTSDVLKLKVRAAECLTMTFSKQKERSQPKEPKDATGSSKEKGKSKVVGGVQQRNPNSPTGREERVRRRSEHRDGSSNQVVRDVQNRGRDSSTDRWECVAKRNRSKDGSSKQEDSRVAKRNRSKDGSSKQEDSGSDGYNNAPCGICYKTQADDAGENKWVMCGDSSDSDGEGTIGCKRWFHNECVQASDDVLAEDAPPYMCPFCASVSSR